MSVSPSQCCYAQILARAFIARSCNKLTRTHHLKSSSLSLNNALILPCNSTEVATVLEEATARILTSKTRMAKVEEVTTGVLLPQQGEGTIVSDNRPGAQCTSKETSC
jgi:hypothetical protein